MPPRFWRAAGRIAWRDARSSPRRALAAILTVAAGVAAVGAVRSLSATMRAKVRGDAREWIAADIYVTLEEAPGEDEMAAVRARLGAEMEDTTVTEFYGMAASDEAADPVLVFVKVVDPAFYPFYGTMELRPPQPLRQALSPDSVVVSESLLDALKLRTGGRLRAGRAELRVSAEIRSEPDWSAGLSTVLPRVILTRAAMRRTGWAPAGDVNHKVLFHLSGGDVEAARQRIEKEFPGREVVDYRDPDPTAAAVFDQAATYLAAAAWMALAIGAVAVALILYLHIQGRLESVAVMKVLGARSKQVLAIYTLQALGLAVAGGVAGTAAALPLEHAMAAVARRAYPIDLTASWDWRFGWEAVAVGLAAALPAVAGPVWRLRRVKPLAALRRPAADADAMPRRIRLPRFLPPALRLGARNLVRPGSHSMAMIIALAAGVAMLSAAFVCQRELSGKIANAIPPSGFNLYLISAGRHQLDEAAGWLAGQPGVEGAPREYPLISLQLQSINQKPVEGVSTPRAWLSTCADSIPAGEMRVSSGASALPVRTGDQLEFHAREHTLRARATANPADYQDEVIPLLTFSCADFSGLPVFYHAALRVTPGQEAAVRRALAAKFPGIPTLSRSEFRKLLNRVAEQTMAMVQLVSWMVLAVGMVLMALLVAAGKRLRMQEIAVAKALGARPRTLAAMFAAEFGLLGMAAGAAGWVLGMGLSSALLSAVFQRATAVTDIRVLPAAMVLTGLLAAAAGIASGGGRLQRKAIEILREE